MIKLIRLKQIQRRSNNKLKLQKLNSKLYLIHKLKLNNNQNKKMTRRLILLHN